jgi:phytoene desaturase
MHTQKSAIIIGAGIGGIATSVYLARQGYKVTVFEKNATPGGRCGQLIREGHRFDVGATIFLMPSIYRHVFESLGLKLEESFDISTLANIYEIFFDDGSRFEFTTDNERMRDQLEKIEPGSFSMAKKYIAEGYRFFNLSMNSILGKNYYSFFEFISLKTMLMMMQIKPFTRHSSYVRKFFKNPKLRMAFTFQNIYVGQSPYDAPALFSMLPGAELTEGALFPKGGMYSLVEKLLDMAVEAGVVFQYNNPVTKIEVNRHSVEKLVFEDGSEATADIFIANADLPYIYTALLPDKAAARKMEHMKYSCSAISFHWGVDKVFPQLGHHNVFLNNEYHGGMDAIFKYKGLSNRPNFYIHAPVRTDPGAAPANHDTLTVIIPASNVDELAGQDWKTISEKARAFVIKKLSDLVGENFEPHIKFEMCLPPTAWQNYYNVARGGVFGSLSHSIMQMGYFRPHNRHNKYNNLYFAGGSTHPGNGVPLVLLSAKLTSERILKENEN